LEERPEASWLDVSQVGEEIIITTDNDETVIGDTYYAYDNSTHTKLSLTTYDVTPVSKYDISIQNGPVEIIIEGNEATLTVHGTSGIRYINLPGSGWQLVSPLYWDGNHIVWDYSGENPVTIKIKR